MSTPDTGPVRCVTAVLVKPLCILGLEFCAVVLLPILWILQPCVEVLPLVVETACVMAMLLDVGIVLHAGIISDIGILVCEVKVEGIVAVLHEDFVLLTSVEQVLVTGIL